MEHDQYTDSWNSLWNKLELYYLSVLLFLLYSIYKCLYLIAKTEVIIIWIFMADGVCSCTPTAEGSLSHSWKAVRLHLVRVLRLNGNMDTNTVVNCCCTDLFPVLRYRCQQMTDVNGHIVTHIVQVVLSRMKQQHLQRARHPQHSLLLHL